LKSGAGAIDAFSIDPVKLPTIVIHGPASGDGSWFGGFLIHNYSLKA